MFSNYILWDLNPEIIKIGALPIRWYGLMFVLPFLIAPKIATHIYKTERRPIKDIEIAVGYCMMGTIIGARLGHVIFYDLHYYLQNPIEAFLPISFNPTFHFTGYQGLASHGGAIALIVSTYLYCNWDIKIGLFPPKFSAKRIKRVGQSFRWMGDIISIFCALAAFSIRMGNFSNSEIYGKQTDKPIGVIFAPFWINDTLPKRCPAVEKVVTNKSKNVVSKNKKFEPLQINITFKKYVTNEKKLKDYIENNVKYELQYNNRINQHIYIDENKELNYILYKNKENRYVAKIYTLGIPRHASQLYESLSSLILFILMLLWWKFRWKKIKEGQITGAFWMAVFGLRFFYEFLKLGDIPFSNILPLNRAQLLSIACILFGAIFFIASKKPHYDPKLKDEN
ncbi:MAG: hypothetical protein GY830_04980 [Bacteroidetes bacterium]|nr:hypothetical protein [Bacteroidota bacterium]